LQLTPLNPMTRTLESPPSMIDSMIVTQHPPLHPVRARGGLPAALAACLLVLTAPCVALAQPGGTAGANNLSAKTASRPYIDVVGGNPTPYPVAVPEASTAAGATAADAEPAQVVLKVVRDDLTFSGFFNVLDPKGYLANPNEGAARETIEFNKWAQVGAQGLVKAVFAKAGDGFELTVRVFDVGAATQLNEKTYKGSSKNLRRTGHDIANDLVEFFTREPGIFHTRLVYVEKKVAAQSALHVMDYDGANDTLVYRNGSINILPSWRPDGRAILYTGYMFGNPDLFRIFIDSKLTTRVSNRPGMNSGAQFSPDGKKIALTLSFSENSEIYVMDADGKNLTRLTNDWGIDTSPSWSPDGKRIAFVSTRSGRPHLYVMNADGSNQRRLTFVGDYNQEPRWSPRGDWIAFTARDERFQFDLFMINPDDSNKIQRLTQDQGNNESPTWAPNGRYLAFQSTRGGGPTQIYIMDANGERQRRITDRPWRCEQPSWEPFNVAGVADLPAIEEPAGGAAIPAATPPAPPADKPKGRK
jgi:TolB protein